MQPEFIKGFFQFPTFRPQNSSIIQNIRVACPINSYPSPIRSSVYCSWSVLLLGTRSSFNLIHHISATTFLDNEKHTSLLPRPITQKSSLSSLGFLETCKQMVSFLKGCEQIPGFVVWRCRFASVGRQIFLGNLNSALKQTE